MKLYNMAFVGPHGYNRYVEGDKPSYYMNRTWNHDKSAQQIKEETGFEYDDFIGWFYEVADGNLIDDGTFAIGDTTTLGQLYDAPDLYKAYPQLTRLRVEWSTMFKPTSSVHGALRYSYSGMKNQWKRITSMMIVINARNCPKLDDDFKSTLVHEIQHVIQRFEKYNSGTKSAKRYNKNERFRKSTQYNVAFDGFHFIQCIVHELYPEECPKPKKSFSLELFMCWLNHRDDIVDWINENCKPLFDEHYDDIQKGIAYMDEYAEDDYWDDDYIRYKRSKHETQARNVSRRMNMTADERRKSLAKDTEDIPFDKQTYSVEKIELEDENDWT